MYINEMASGSAVLVEVKNKEGKELTLTTEVVDSFERGDYKMVMVEALRHNGQLLSFNSVICQAMITNAENNKAYKYKLLGIIKRDHEGNVYHCLISNDDAAEENRRGAKRFAVGARANIQVLGTTKALRGYVHDISATGISFLVGDANLNAGDKVSVDFQHEITGAQLKVIAQIVRCEERDKGTFYGCVVHRHDSKYNLLISYLMRQECKVRG